MGGQLLRDCLFVWLYLATSLPLYPFKDLACSSSVENTMSTTQNLELENAQLREEVKNLKKEKEVLRMYLCNWREDMNKVAEYSGSVRANLNGILGGHYELDPERVGNPHNINYGKCPDEGF